MGHKSKKYKAAKKGFDIIEDILEVFIAIVVIGILFAVGSLATDIDIINHTWLVLFGGGISAIGIALLVNLFD